ncbi:MAG: kynureninase, partial [Acidobacteriota bacterium]
AVGAAVGFDLAHAAGNVPLSLHGWNADFAVWCSYKYLNGGPGAPGGCFVHERHARSPNLPRLAGWWGTDRSTRFTMAERFQPEVGAGGWQLSNPPMLAMAAVKASLDLFAEVGMETLRSKSENLTGFLHALLADGERLPYEVVTPPSAGERGCQLSIRVRSDAGEMVGELAARGFVLDARPPDIVRVAPVPFFNTFRDVWEFARAFRELAGVDAG